MTAEIAILNKYGLALAADSKVTIGSGIKAFDTVTKIFPLSRIHPVALMIWGNPDFMEIPIEIICKQYRSKKGTIPEKSIAEWGDDFISYLKNFSEHDDNIKARNISSIVNSWFGEIRSLSQREARQRETPLTSPEFAEILKRQIGIKTDEMVAKEDFLPDDQVREFIEQNWDAIQPILFEHIGQYDNGELAKIASVFAIASLSKEPLSNAIF